MQTKHIFNVHEKVKVSPIVKHIGVVSFTILSILFGMLFLPWEQTIKGSGKLVAFDPTQRAYEIRATYGGFVSKYHVSENQHVKKGDPLCTIIDQDSKYEMRLEQKLDSLSKELDAVTKRLRSLENEKKQIQSYYKNGLNLIEGRKKQSLTKQKSLQEQLLANKSAFETVSKKLHRTKELFGLGLESKQNLESVENNFINIKSKYEQSENELQYEKQNYKNLLNEKEQFINTQNTRMEKNAQSITRTQTDTQILQRTKVDLQTQQERYAGRVLRAQKDGIVMRIFQNDQNRLITKGEKLFYFVPDVTKRAILLKISDFNMPLLKKDLPVRIMFNGWPALQISGWPKITHGTFGGYIHNLEPLSHEEGFYYAYVFEQSQDPWPSDDLLRYGSQATLWVRLESVPIWYQIWRRINATPPNMPLER